LLVTAVFLLTLLQRVFSGPLEARWSGFPDLTRRERILILPATFLMLFVGMYPQILLQLVNPTVIGMVEGLQP
jgi:NADH-quinone oxidoreductase subunit M